MDGKHYNISMDKKDKVKKNLKQLIYSELVLLVVGSWLYTVPNSLSLSKKNFPVSILQKIILTTDSNLENSISNEIELVYWFSEIWLS